MAWRNNVVYALLTSLLRFPLEAEQCEPELQTEEPTPSPIYPLRGGLKQGDGRDLKGRVIDGRHVDGKHLDERHGLGGEEKLRKDLGPKERSGPRENLGALTFLSMCHDVVVASTITHTQYEELVQVTVKLIELLERPETRGDMEEVFSVYLLQVCDVLCPGDSRHAIACLQTPEVLRLIGGKKKESSKSQPATDSVSASLPSADSPSADLAIDQLASTESFPGGEPSEVGTPVGMEATSGGMEATLGGMGTSGCVDMPGFGSACPSASSWTKWRDSIVRGAQAISNLMRHISSRVFRYASAEMQLKRREQAVALLNYLTDVATMQYRGTEAKTGRKETGLAHTKTEHRDKETEHGDRETENGDGEIGEEPRYEGMTGICRNYDSEAARRTVLGRCRTDHAQIFSSLGFWLSRYIANKHIYVATRFSSV